MKVCVGTTNKRKLEAVRDTFKELVSNDSVEINGYQAKSNVPETPLDEKAILGALNRAKDVRKSYKNQDLYLGIESGLVNRYGDPYEEVWVVAIHGNKVYAAYSSGVKLPDQISKELNTDVQNHPEVMESIRTNIQIKTNDTLGVDTWGDYSGNKLSRETGFREAVRNTLIQIFPEKDSLY